MTKDQALERGALAFFGEKYGKTVRVLEMGEFSIELCGGTHVANTNEIQNFLILSEASLSSGVRRIEAATSEGANTILRTRSTLLKDLAQKLNCREDMVEGKIDALQSDVKKLQKEIKGYQQKSESNKSQALFDETKKSGEYVYSVLEVAGDADLKNMSDFFVDKYKNGLLALFCEKKGKLSLLVRTNKANKNINCSKLLNSILESVGGRGGGRPDMAQGSGSMPGDTKIFISSIESLFQENLK